MLWSSLCSGILDELRINNCLRINSSTGIAGLWQQQKWHFLQSALSVQSVHFVLTASTASSSHSAGLSPFYVDVIILTFLFQFPFFWRCCLHGNLFQQLLNHHGLLLPGRASVGICCFLQHKEHQFSFQTICFYWIWFVTLFSNSKNPLSAKLMVLNNISWPKPDDKSDSGCAFACMWKRRGRS